MTQIPINTQASVILVEVVFKGVLATTSLELVLDTGATITTIPFETAIAIGCDPIKSRKRIEMITASGIEYVPVVKIPAIEVFGFSLRNIDAICHNLPPHSPAAGLLGLNILKIFDLHFKFRSKTLEVIK